ncbi:Thiamine pyrophosphate-requiring enzyme [Cinnamomum micranthum f. kanehirae]|uniref:Thiamine pyrophosphate-requiring enzyme n=1 Tax=Cinnamomum micranthum f. kanehirae TaxID=337451 RepID=A0A3S3NG94_9MAGN|nr:Thiamine pyrophosphate-requiring enzyme [Cinnamomum micranthum f. kanehirae]
MTLQGLNTLLEEMKAAGKLDLDFWAWREELKAQKKRFPLSFTCFGGSIPPQHAIQVLDELTNSDAIITTGVGQHQMWAAQWYNYKNPRQLITSSGLGAMGFGLPVAIGAAVASPGSLIVDIYGDGSFLMNIQELATIAAEELNGNRGDTYLGHPSKHAKIFPDFLKFAEGCDIPAARVTQKNELRGAILKMLQTPGPYLLDVIVSHQEYVFPIIPAGGSFRDVIIEGSRRTIQI